MIDLHRQTHLLYYYYNTNVCTALDTWQTSILLFSLLIILYFLLLLYRWRYSRQFTSSLLLLLLLSLFCRTVRKTYIRTGRRDLRLLNCRHDPQQYRCFTGGLRSACAHSPGPRRRRHLSAMDECEWGKKTRTYKFVLSNPRAIRTHNWPPRLHINIRYHDCDGRRRKKTKLLSRRKEKSNFSSIGNI